MQVGKGIVEVWGVGAGQWLCFALPPCLPLWSGINPWCYRYACQRPSLSRHLAVCDQPHPSCFLPPVAVRRVKTIVWDKTGTLTTGKPHVVDARVLDKRLGLSDVVQLAAAVEQHSEHPIATAILSLHHQQQVRQQQGQGQGQDAGKAASAGGPAPVLQARSVEAIVGQGISGWVRLPAAASSPRAAAAVAAGKHSGSGSSSGINTAALLEMQAPLAGAVRAASCGTVLDRALSSSPSLGSLHSSAAAGSEAVVPAAADAVVLVEPQAGSPVALPEAAAATAAVPAAAAAGGRLVMRQQWWRKCRVAAAAEAADKVQRKSGR